MCNVISGSQKVNMAHYKGAASEAGRAMHLMKKREKAQQEIELRKKKIEEDLKISNIENKFAAHYDAVEQQLKVYLKILFYLKIFLYKDNFRSNTMFSTEFYNWFSNS